MFLPAEMVFALFTTVMEMNPQRGDLCTITDITFRHGRVKQNADCSHIENEEEEEDDWEKENQMEVQWEVGGDFWNEEEVKEVP